MDTDPRGARTEVPPPQGREAPEGTGKDTKGAGRAFLPASIWTRCDGGALTTSRPGQPVLVVWQRRAAVTIPSFCQVLKAGTGDQAALAES